MHERSLEYESNDHDVIARASCADGREVLLLMAPATALNGYEGPVIIPGFDSDRVHVVLSDEFLSAFVIADDDSAETRREKLALLAYAVRESLSFGIDALEGLI
jgi:hypothetical protein